MCHKTGPCGKLFSIPRMRPASIGLDKTTKYIISSLLNQLRNQIILALCIIISFTFPSWMMVCLHAIKMTLHNLKHDLPLSLLSESRIASPCQALKLFRARIVYVFPEIKLWATYYTFLETSNAAMSDGRVQMILCILLIMCCCKNTYNFSIDIFKPL